MCGCLKIKTPACLLFEVYAKLMLKTKTPSGNYIGSVVLKLLLRDNADVTLQHLFVSRCSTVSMLKVKVVKFSETFYKT